MCIIPKVPDVTLPLSVRITQALAQLDADLQAAPSTLDFFKAHDIRGLPRDERQCLIARYLKQVIQDDCDIMVNSTTMIFWDGAFRLGLELPKNIRTVIFQFDVGQLNELAEPVAPAL